MFGSEIPSDDHRRRAEAVVRARHINMSDTEAGEFIAARSPDNLVENIDIEANVDLDAPEVF